MISLQFQTILLPYKLCVTEKWEELNVYTNGFFVFTVFDNYTLYYKSILLTYKENKR